MASSQPRPKRAGEDFTRSHLNQADSEGPSDKKPRFDLRNPSALAPDAPEEDAILDADEIGRRGQKVRRKAINIDGYDSDSEDEGFPRHRDEKTDEKKDDGDDDMFAELEEEFGDKDGEADEEARKKKNDTRFLQNDEIEGQEASSKGGMKLHADLSKGADAIDKQESESDSEVDEEERDKADEELDEEIGAGGKKKHAPLLDAFNMSTEQEEGRFDEAGNYVRKAIDPDAAYDSWLDGVSKKDIRKAKEAAEKRDEERKEKNRIDGEVLSSDALATLITNLERGETILEALARLGKGLQRKPKWQNKKKNSKKEKEPEDTEMTDENSDEARRRKAIEAVTGAADILMGRGQVEIYDTERELLTRQYKSETGEDWVDPTTSSENAEAEQGPSMWEYRWSDARDGGDAHGPYESAMMQSWQSAGYFGDGVEFRRVGDTGPWSSTVNFV
ncbi:hypothetical protein PENSTE_c003G08511 [Penicillium steckii]|uniref:GYF domain-containing protein n=1 Tax=Penicillium steckii TaxID=303698 RepID=A0A1V6TRK1_9EURO|nr:hypothetical protein PENSTE_c003G08511 [Penicillium steckii]